MILNYQINIARISIRVTLCLQPEIANIHVIFISNMIIIPTYSILNKYKYFINQH